MHYLSGWVTQSVDLALEIRASTVAVGRPDNKQNSCKMGKNEELRFRKGSPLVCRVMGIACSSYVICVWGCRSWA